MRVISFARYQWNEETLRYELVEEWSHEHEGPVARCGGGPSAASQAASKAALVNANSAADNSSTMMEYLKQQQAAITPFATNLMTKGAYPNYSDYNSAQNAQAWQPAYAAAGRRLSSMGSLPSGFKSQTMANLDASRAQSYDQSLFFGQQQNEASKLQGAQLLAGQQVNAAPAQWNQTAASGYNSVIQSPQTPGLASVLGGVAGQGLNMLGNIYCWVAAAVFNEDMMGEKTCLVRHWLLKEFAKHWYAAPILGAYRRWGKWASRQPILVRALTPLFELALRRAGGAR